jgi:hypothetical protein
MPSSLTTLLIVALVSLVLGVVAGSLLNLLRNDREEEPQTGEETPPGGRPGGYLPVVRLWHEKTNEKLIVEVDGKSFVAPGPLAPEQRAKLEKALAELAGWLGVQVGGAPVQPARGLPQAAHSSMNAAAQPSAEQQRDVISLPPVMPIAQPLAQTGRLTKTSPLVAPVIKEKPKSIVSQIDAILQDLLISTGMDNRGIGLTEDPRRGVIVTVGIQRFEGIDAVTDPEIKKILRTAVSEWERRQVPPPRI